MTVHLEPARISDELCRFAQAHLFAEGVAFTAQTPLAEAGLDSFSLVELLLYSERAFGVAVPESHLTRENLATMDALARCIAGLAARPDAVPPAPPR